MQPFSKTVCTLILGAVIATLAGCSEYLDRRDTIALGSGNAVATDQVTHMVDPWPRESANRDIAFEGNKMQSAYERYRTNKVTPPSGTGTSGTYQPPQAATPPAPVGPTVTQPAAPVK